MIIISNNVEPESLEFEIVGDVYHFMKENIFKNENLNEQNTVNAKFPKITIGNNGEKYYKTDVV